MRLLKHTRSCWTSLRSLLLKLILLSWNVRGVNNFEKRKVIKQFIRDQRVDLVCLQETKVQEMSHGLACSLRVGRFSKWGTVDAIGTVGGLMLFWDKRILELIGMVNGSSPFLVCLGMWKTGSIRSSHVSMAYLC